MLQHLITQQHYFALKLFAALGCGLIAGVFLPLDRRIREEYAKLFNNTLK